MNSTINQNTEYTPKPLTPHPPIYQFHRLKPVATDEFNNKSKH
jgi:hypothetical protein